jgi:hypothetical protein
LPSKSQAQNSVMMLHSPLSGVFCWITAVWSQHSPHLGLSGWPMRSRELRTHCTPHIEHGPYYPGETCSLKM